MNVQRLNELHAYIASLPAERVNLNTYYSRLEDCGCAAGLAAKVEMFELQLDRNDRVLYKFPDGTTIPFFKGALSRVFDIPDTDVDKLFSIEKGFGADYDMKATYRSHKELWLYRFACFAKEKGFDLQPVHIKSKGPATKAVVA